MNFFQTRTGPVSLAPRARRYPHLIALAGIFAIALNAAVPPSTGVAPANGQQPIAGRDLNYQITFDNTQAKNPVASGSLSPAYVVTKYALYWAGDPATGTPGTGAAWIAPAADQGNSTTTSVKGNSTYSLQFTVIDPSAGLSMIMTADDNLVVSLYNSAAGSPFMLFSSNGAMYSYTHTITLTHLVKGLNTLTFDVANPGIGPTGLSVAFSGSLGGPPVTGLNTIPATNGGTAVTDPIDSATGQFYDTAIDLELGGPLNLQFARYYSSALSGAGFSSGLGLNWMSNFDVALGVSGTSAKVLLFGGKVVSFTNTGGVWQLQSPLDIVYQLAAAGAGYKFMDPNSRFIYTFSATGALTRIEDRNGNAATVTPGPFGPTLISDGAGRTLTLAYTGGQLTSVTDQGARTFSYGYNGIQLLTATDDAKKVTTYAYTAAGGLTGLLVSKQLPLGNIPTTQAYDTSGRVISQTDGNKNITKIAYDGLGGTTVTNPLAAVKKQSTDSNGDLTAQTDPAGAAAMTLDSANRLISVTDRAGGTTKMSYHSPTGYLASATNPLGNTTTFSYVAQSQDVFTFYNLSSVAYADGTSESFTYDANGNLLSHTAQDGSVTTATYDTGGRVLSNTNPGKATTTYTWNPDSTMATHTDALGNQVVLAYDSLKRLIKITDPNGGASTFGYTIAPDGSHLSFASPAGTGGSTLYYDFNGQPQDFVNDFGGVSHSAYTATENIASFTDPLGKKTTWTYNGADQLASVTDPTGVAVSYGYDPAGHITSVSGASGTLLTYGYTPEGRVSSMTNGTGNQTTYSYDAAGQESGIVAAGGGKIAFGYDKLGNVMSITDALGGVRNVTRDSLGRTVQITLPGSLTTSITRDVEGNPTAIVSPNGDKWIYGYDALGRVTSVNDPVGNSTTYSYQGTQLTGIKTPLGSLALITDKAGDVTKRTFSDGTAMSTNYDSSGRIISADFLTIKRDSKGQPTNINGIGIVLDAAGRPATLTYAPGKAITYSYDLNGRVTSVADWVGGKTLLTYDAASRLSALTYPNGATNTYAYDVNGTVAKIGFGSLGSISLTRDAGGKITAADRSLPTTPSVAGTTQQQFSYDAAAQLSSAVYDPMGRVTSQGGRTYNWNLASQLTSYVDGANSPSFTYDGLGELNSMTSGSSVRSFVVNYLLPYPALSIVRQGASDLRYYVYLPNGKLLYSIESDNTRHFYHFDEMGNTVMLTDANGAASDTYAITPYGEIATHVGTADNPFTWQGQYGVFQEGTSLYNVRSRHYDASAARFVSRDSVRSADPRSVEPYAYANGNPLLFTDPFGSGIDVSQLPPSAVDAFLVAEIKSGKIKVDNFFEQIVIATLDQAVTSNKSVNWTTIAKDLGLTSTTPIFTFLNAEYQLAIAAKAPPAALKMVAIVTAPPATPPVRVVYSLLSSAKPTPTAAQRCKASILCNMVQTGLDMVDSGIDPVVAQITVAAKALSAPVPMPAAKVPLVCPPTWSAKLCQQTADFSSALNQFAPGSAGALGDFVSVP